MSEVTQEEHDQLVTLMHTRYQLHLAALDQLTDERAKYKLDKDLQTAQIRILSRLLSKEL